jgi:hypothetical protein
MLADSALGEGWLALAEAFALVKVRGERIAERYESLSWSLFLLPDFNLGYKTDVGVETLSLMHPHQYLADPDANSLRSSCSRCEYATHGNSIFSMQARPHLPPT